MPRPAESHSRGEQRACVRAFVPLCVCCMLYMRVFQCVRIKNRVWYVYSNEYVCVCVCVTPGCVLESKDGKKKQFQDEATSKQQTEAEQLLQILQKLSLFFFFFNHNICRPPSHLYAHHGSKWLHRTTELTQQQQPHNKAVNKEDVSASLCFAANW